MCRAELNGISSGATFCLFSAPLANLADYSFHPALRYNSAPILSRLIRILLLLLLLRIFAFVNDEHNV